MTNEQILTTLHRHAIYTVGDLDHYAEIRRLSRWHALAQLVGAEAADLVMGLLAVRLCRTLAAEAKPRG